MKYFTPELLLKIRDETEGDAYNEWEKAISDYLEKSKTLPLSESIKKFNEHVCLHDAKITFGNFGDFGLLSTKLQFVAEDKSYLCVLRYTTAYPGDISTHCNGEQDGVKIIYHKGFDATLNSYWLYDEFDYLGHSKGGGYALPPRDIFEHSILFAGGTEITIRFMDFHFIYVPIKEGYICG